MRLQLRVMESPVGRLRLVASATGLLAVLWERDDARRAEFNEAELDTVPTGGVCPANALLQQAADELAEYFAGRRTRFEVPLEPRGTTFQLQVWEALRGIPFGETRSYGQLARELGQPTASRAVGAANGRNPLAIVVPCHRVVGSTGKLTGFAGGFEAKAQLLALEGAERRLFP